MTKQPPIIVWFEALLDGGAELQALGIAADLQEAGRHVHVLAHRRGQAERASALIARHGLELTVLPRPRYGRGFRYLPSLAPTATFLQQFHAPSILASLTGPNVTAGLLRPLVRARRVVWTQHDEGLWRFRRYQERLAVSLCTAIVAVSRRAREHLVRDLNVRPERIRIIPNAARIEAPRFSREEWRRRVRASPHSVVFVMVANITAAKDHETLLRAWREVKLQTTAESAEALLVLAGRRGDTSRRVESLIAEFGLDDSVRLPGPVTDVAGLLRASDVGVLSSRCEGSPVALLEYFRCELPVIATDIGAVDEIDPDRRAVLSASSGDVGRLAQQLKSLTGDRAQRQRLTEASRVISRRYSSKYQSQQYLDLL